MPSALGPTVSLGCFVQHLAYKALLLILSPCNSLSGGPGRQQNLFQSRDMNYCIKSLQFFLSLKRVCNAGREGSLSNLQKWPPSQILNKFLSHIFRFLKVFPTNKRTFIETFLHKLQDSHPSSGNGTSNIWLVTKVFVSDIVFRTNQHPTRTIRTSRH